MLFGKKNCTQCGSSYDIVSDTCPACHTRDEQYETLGIPKNIIWLPIYKQILLFVIGFVGLEILGTILGIVFYPYVNDQAFYLTVVNSLRYVIIAIGLGCLLIGNYKSFKKGFVNWWPYLVGIGGIIALFFFSFVYHNFINMFHPTTDNANQEAVNSVVGGYPILSLLVLGILGPVVEELTYRVGLFSFLMRTKRWIAYVVTILVFAFIHFDFTSIITGIQTQVWDNLINELLNLPEYIAAGGALCALYDTCGLSAALVTHIGNNLFSILLYILNLKLPK